MSQKVSLKKVPSNSPYGYRVSTSPLVDILRFFAKKEDDEVIEIDVEETFTVDRLYEKLNSQVEKDELKEFLVQGCNFEFLSSYEDNGDEHYSFTKEARLIIERSLA